MIFRVGVGAVFNGARWGLRGTSGARLGAALHQRNGKDLSTTRTKCPCDFPKRCLRIKQVLQHILRDHKIETRVGKSLAF